jgi:hypothetical protein
MAVFTAIATAIIGAIGITGTLATIATAFVAAGLAIGTAKILGVMSAPQAGEDPGVKVQLPPATDNKVPRLYGRNFTGGTIIDAEIKNQNKTMTYALVLSDMSDIFAETWSVGAIYRGDALLNFSGANVISQTDPNATSSPAIANKIRVRVYAGGSSAANQIFPTTGAVNAYGGTSTSKSGQFLNWTAANTMTDLVFAIVEVDYDAENDLVGLGVITFDIFCNLSNPGRVLVDYLNNERYGMGNVNFPVSVSGNVVNPENIDIVSLNDWINYSVTNNTFINGGLSTFDSIRTNVNKICMSGGAFFTYNNKTGNFGVVVNTGANAAVKANAFVLSDDNLVGSLGVTSTDLFNMYNQMEVEFPSIIQKDQTDTVFLEIPDAQRNINEPDNKLNVRFQLTNDRQVAINLANIDLRQGRFTTVVTAKGDFTTLPIDVGDIVKLNNETFNWTNKLFRVMQTKEVETAESMLYNELVLLEYDDSIFVWNSESPSVGILPPGIPNWWMLNTNANVTIGNVFVGDNVVYGGNAIGYNPSTGNVTSNTVTIDNLLTNSNSSIGNTNPVIGFPFYIPPNVTFDGIDVRFINNSTSNAGSANSVITDTMRPPPGQSFFTPDRTYWFTRNLNQFTNLNGGDDYIIQANYRDSYSGTSSRTFTTASIPINVQNTVDNKQVADYAAGVQVENFQDFSVTLANNTTLTKLITPIQVDLTGIDPKNDYSLIGSGVPQGGYNANSQLGLAVFGNVTFANATSSTTVDYNGSGVQIISGTVVPTMVDATAINIDPAYLSTIDPFFAPNMLPQTGNVWVEGYSTLDDAVYDREFISPKAQFLKVTKNERLA